MLCVPQSAASVVTRAYVLRMLSARALDHSPISGMRCAIGPPNKNRGIIAGNRNTRSGYFLVTQTVSTPFSFKILISTVSFSFVGVFLGALVL